MRVDLLPEDTNASSQIASFRLDLDSSSSPGPNGSLLVVPGFYNPTNEFNIPLTDNFVGAGLCTSYVVGAGTEFDLTNMSTGVVGLIRGGHFNLSFTCYIVDSVNEADGTIVMILLNGQLVFASPPATACSRTQGDAYSAVLPGLLIKSLTGACNIIANPGDEIVMRVLLNNVTPGNDCMIQLCTNLSCTKIDYNLYGIAGQQGIPGNDGVIQSVDNVNNGPPVGTTSLVQNPGANPNILIKNLKEGSNITITDNGTDLEISAAGSALPDSDFANLGVGEQVLVTSGILPVTNTRNFKTLLAGSNITLTPTANDITISSTGGSNIYNADGSLTSARTLTLNSNNLTFTGTGNFNVTNTGQVNIGTTNATLVTVGRNGVQTVLPAANIALSNLPVDPGIPTEFITYNTATKVLRYASANFYHSIFSVGLQAFTIAGPFAAFYNIPSTIGIAYSTAQPTNHPGYNDAGVTLNLVLGNYTPSQTNRYEIVVMLSVKNDLEVPDLTIQIRDIMAGLHISECKCTSGQVNKYNTFVLSDRVELSAARLYTIRMLLNNGAATTYDFERFVWSINLI